MFTENYVLQLLNHLTMYEVRISNGQSLDEETYLFINSCRKAIMRYNLLYEEAHRQNLITLKKNWKNRENID